MTETFYDVLGVRSDATTEEIEAAYRDAIKRVHPDVSNDVDAGERTKRLNKARRVLTDESERERYDRVGHEVFTGEGSAGRDGTGGSATGGDGSATDANGSPTDANGSPTGADGSGTGANGAANGAGSRGPSAGTERTDASGSNRRGSASSEPTDGSRSRSGGVGQRGGGASDRWRNGESDREGTWRGSQQRGRRTRNGPNSRPGDRTRRTRSDHQRGRRGDGRTADGTTRSRGDSTGPSWQSSVDETGTGPSARRQAAAAANGGPNVDWSWNDRASAGSWAVRDGSSGRGLRLSRLFPIDQSVVLLASTFFLYPFFVASALFPPFPLAARVVVAVCTLLTFAYLLSIPEAAIAVFGLWSVLVPIALLAFPGLSLFSLVGVIALVATWVPLGLSVLTFTLVRP